MRTKFNIHELRDFLTVDEVPMSYERHCKAVVDSLINDSDGELNVDDICFSDIEEGGKTRYYYTAVVAADGLGQRHVPLLIFKGLFNNFLFEKQI